MAKKNTSFKHAALGVLSRAHAPLHADVITERAIRYGLLKTSGWTPEATMRRTLNSESSKPGSEFKKLTHSYFMLS